jgi:predicted transposase/invertase (TIGR01784 family)
MEKEAKDKLVEEVNRCSHDRGFVELYSMYTQEELERNTILEDEKQMARDEGHQEGFEVGRQDGINQRNMEIAKKLLNMNLEEKQIMEATDLTKEQIDSLKNSN